MTYSGRLTWGLVIWAASFAAWGQSELLVKVKPANKALKANVEGYIGAALAGLGLIQCPHYRMHTQIAQGLIQEVLPDTPPPPMPVSVLYPHNRHMSPRVRVFVDWLGEVFAAAR